MTFHFSLDGFSEWIPKVIKIFDPYRPETKSISINYKDKNSEIEVMINIDDSKKLNRYIVIPAFENFVIERIIDELYTPMRSSIFRDGGNWKIKLDTLRSGRYLIKMKGHVNEDFIKQHVRIQPASNREQTSEIDRYWLDSMLNNVEDLEKIWKTFDIDEVNFGVNISINKVFTTKIPKELNQALDVYRDWIRQGYGTDRQAQFNAWKKMRKMERSIKLLDYTYVSSIIERVTSHDVFIKYISVEYPYNIGTIEKIGKYIFPEKMNIETKTKLNLENPTARGYLTFRKKDYEKIIEDEFSSESK